MSTPAIASSVLRRHWRRFSAFGVIGFTVFLAGLALQVALVRLAGMGHVTSYVIKTLLSVELSLVLNRYLTWRDRDIRMTRAAVLFTVQQLALQGIGVVVYAGMDRLGVGYITANVAVTALLTPVGYLASHLWSLAGQPLLAARETTATARETIQAARAETAPGLVKRRNYWAPLDSVPWPLVAILAVQAITSLRLIWTNTAFLDEATYLFAGHVEIAHWLHGSSAPHYATYFSGAPVIYPPLAALAGDVGGVAGARLLSLVFMLGVTCLLWAVTERLFGRWAAVFATALFVALGPTQFLGAFATFDAMSLFLMTAAVWCVITAGNRDDSTWLLIAAAVLLTLANATKYASTLFDPSIVALGGLVVLKDRGRKSAAGRAGLIAACTMALDAALLALGGDTYVTGVLSTTVSRVAGGSPPSVVLSDAAQWIGIACIPAAISAVVALLRREDRVQAAIVALLAVSGTLAPLNQARIHTTTSLSKHVDFGAWFVAVAGGYLIAQLARIGYRRRAGWVPSAAAAVLASGAVLVPAAAFGERQSVSLFQAWPDSTQITNELQSLVLEHQGRYLTEDYDVPAYYLQDKVLWGQWSDTWYFSYRPPGSAPALTGLAAYQAAIKYHYFALVILDFADTAPTDKAIVDDIRQIGTYHVIAELPFRDKFGPGHFTVWSYEPHAADGGLR